MAIVREINTNKARLSFRKDGIVEKVLFDSERALVEKESIDDLHNTFPGEDFEGWTYKTVKLLGFNEEDSTIYMEEAKGKPYSSIMKEYPSLSFHMGVWLGLYHKRAKLDDGKVKLYGDYSRNNFLIDQEKRLATAIDPGFYFGDVDYPEFDMVLAIYSLTIGAFRTKQSPYKIAESFLRGYKKTAHRDINYRHIRDSWSRLKVRLSSRYKEKSFLLKLFSYSAMHVLNIYINILLRSLFKNSLT